MTGFGRGEAELEGYRLTVEVKTVNHRYLESNIRLPRQLNLLEDRIRQYLQSRINRGKCDVYLTLEETSEKKPALNLDKELAIVYHDSLLQLANYCNLAPDIKLEAMASFPGVISVEKNQDDLDFFLPLVDKALEKAVDELCAMRNTEGVRLFADLKERNDKIAALTEQIVALAPQVVTDYRDKLTDRMQTVLGEIAVDEARLLNEVAFFADKADITEELTRLRSHMQLFTDTIASDEPIGRKLDFILQEMNREVNTIGSKANHPAVTQIVIEIKSEMEKNREQIQNIE